MTARITLRRVGVVAFEAENERGARTRVAGSPELAAKVSERMTSGVPVSPSASPDERSDAGAAMRPMELFLVSLVGCSAMDMVLILTRQREPLTDLVIRVEGERADATPAVYERIAIAVEAHGGVDEKKLARAVELGVRKYCSVASMLRDEVAIELTTTAVPATSE
jgi:putative redox protein